MKRRQRCFMDAVAWEHEIDETDVKLFPSKSGLIDGTDHDLAECGIVEVEVRLVRYVRWGVRAGYRATGRNSDIGKATAMT